MRLSGLQRDVLSLYRKCLRASRKKPADARMRFEAFTRNEFRKNAALDKKDFGAIEYLMRRGQRQLEMARRRSQKSRTNIRKSTTPRTAVEAIQNTSTDLSNSENSFRHIDVSAGRQPKKLVAQNVAIDSSKTSIPGTSGQIHVSNDLSHSRRGPNKSSRNKVSAGLGNSGWDRSYEPIIDPKGYTTMKQAPVDDTVWETVEPLQQSLTLERASRTKSEKKRLTRFTKELILHLQAVSSLQKQCLLASPSVTTLSAHTLGELVPFHAQFRSAGLAVTSAEQKGGINSSKLWNAEKLYEEARAVSRTTTKETRARQLQLSNTSKPKGIQSCKSSTTVAEKSKKLPSSNCLPGRAIQKLIYPCGHDGQRSIASGSTGTTVLDFTPPYEKTYVGQHRRGYSSASSSFTTVGFTPPHEKMMSSTRPRPLIVESSPRSSLPWLRKPDQSPKPPLSTAKVSNASAKADRSASPVSLRSAETFQVPQDADNPRWLPRLSTDIGWNSFKYASENQQNDMPLPPVRCEAATQTEVTDNTYIQPSNIVISVHSATQTVPLSAGGLDIEVSPGQTPISNSPSNSFPPLSVKCTNNYNELPGSKDPENPRQRQVRLPWLVQNQGNQTAKDQETTSFRIGRPVNEPEWPSKRPSTQTQNNIQDINKTIEDPSIIKPSPLRCIQCNAALKCKADGLDSQPQSNPACEDSAHSSLRFPQCPPSVYTTVPIYTSEPPPLPPKEATQSGAEVTTIPEPLNLLRHAVGHKEKTKDTLEEKEAQLEQNEKVMEPRKQNEIAEYARMHPVADPLKRPSLPEIETELRLRKNCHSYHSSQYKHYHHRQGTKKVSSHHHVKLGRAHYAAHHQPAVARHYTTSSQKHLRYLRERPFPKPSSPIQDPASTTPSLETCPMDHEPITNKQVFSGLQVATAAACDKNLDNWIAEVNGTRVRHFLADLGKFEPLGINALAAVAKDAARERRDKLKAWEAMRAKINNSHTKNHKHMRSETEQYHHAWDKLKEANFAGGLGQVEESSSHHLPEMVEGSDGADDAKDMKVGKDSLAEMAVSKNVEERESRQRKPISIGWRRNVSIGC